MMCIFHRHDLHIETMPLRKYSHSIDIIIGHEEVTTEFAGNFEQFLVI